MRQEATVFQVTASGELITVCPASNLDGHVADGSWVQWEKEHAHFFIAEVNLEPWIEEIRFVGCDCDGNKTSTLGETLMRFFGGG